MTHTHSTPRPAPDAPFSSDASGEPHTEAGAGDGGGALATNATAEAVERHLDISLNHEAGLIPVSTRILLQSLATHLYAHPAPVADAELEALVERLFEAGRNHTEYPLDEVSGDLSCADCIGAAYAISALRARTAQPVGVITVQCCMCGKTGLSTEEDGGPECELHDARWVCSGECWEKAARLTGPVPWGTTQPVGVRVKPLEWENIGRCVGWSFDREDTHLHTASALGRFYEVALGKDGWWAKWQGDYRARGLDTPEAAKAAAKADYEQRILSALLPDGGAHG